MAVLLDSIQMAGFQRVILCAGFQAKEVEEYCHEKQFPFQVIIAKEEAPLGTGGAVKAAEKFLESPTFLVLNGDSYCKIHYKKFLDFHKQKQALATIAVTHTEDPSDFGSIVFDEENHIIRFEEKAEKHSTPAFINAGIYAFEKTIFSFMPEREVFSLEKDVFPSLVGNAFFAYTKTGNFFDIGTPERLRKAQQNFE